jgi:hypothetical protein
MANIMEIISKIINNNNVANNFFYLRDRWQDESKYEDINDYGKSLYKTIAKEFPTINAEYVSSTQRPFGVKVRISGVVYHFHTKAKGRYIVLCAKKCK